MLMWIGEPRDAEEVPAWTFTMANQEDARGLKGVLTKVFYERNFKEKIENSCHAADQPYLEQQVVGDVQPDVEMEELDKISDFEFEGLELDSDGGLSARSGGDGEGMQEDEAEFSEAVQALGYDSTFILQGPVVKMFR